MTIHTTSWFREMPHFEMLERRLRDAGSSLIGQKFRFLSAACSSGEELYSAGCVLESFRRQYVGFEYELHGADLDPVSIEKARAAIFEIDKFDSIPRNYQPFFSYRKNISTRTFSVDAQIRKRSFFFQANLLEIDKSDLGQFDLIFCRNVLIYFKPEEVEATSEKLFKFLRPSGHFCIGHCETISTKNVEMTCIGNATYTPRENSRDKISLGDSIHILIVDDSRSVCEWLRAVFDQQGITSHAVQSADEATKYVREHVVNLVVLDFNLPLQSGLDWLKVQRRNNFQAPVVLFTDVQAQDAPQILDALNGLAQDYVNKAWVNSSPADFVNRMRSIVYSRKMKFENLDRQTQKKNPERASVSGADLILVGASTGGTEAMSRLLTNMPANSPAVVCVQHIPVEFSEAFFKRLCQSSGLKPGVCRHGQEILPGHLYLPTSEIHVGFRQTGARLFIHLSNADKIWSQRPSVDFLFQSASFVTEKKIIAALLTGMGKDGAAGLLQLKKTGSFTMVQDQNSSMVWGMPGEAYKMGAVQYMGDIDQLREVIHSAVKAKNAA